jgi:SagB-type dehydrogenase family enzyme
MPLKTSPSAGARHPIEVYVLALAVDGLDPGSYHYRPADHELELVSARSGPETARAWCAGQAHPANASAIFVMTAVFDRSMWKYPNPRAYRTVLLDAGHLGQTFCLTATHLGLASFCTAALKDSLIEDDLGLDGISESAIYVVGAGRSATSIAKRK